MNALIKNTCRFASRNAMISNILVSERRSKTLVSLRSMTEKAAQVKKAEDNLETTNPYYDKYRDKIAKMKQDNPALFREKLDSLITPAAKTESSSQKIPDGKKEVLPDPSCSNKKFDNVRLHQKDASLNQNSDTISSLDKIMRLELLHDLPTAEITELWKNYHVDKNYVCAVINSDDYKLFQEMIGRYPVFLLALPKNGGFEFIYTQGQFSTLLFTKLSSYQLHGENAPVILSLRFYTDLSESKQIILMRGEYDPDSLSPIEAQSLVNQHQIFYNKGISADDQQRLKLVESFNTKPEEFDYNLLLKLIPGYET